MLVERPAVAEARGLVRRRLLDKLQPEGQALGGGTDDGDQRPERRLHLRPQRVARIDVHAEPRPAPQDVRHLQADAVDPDLLVEPGRAVADPLGMGEQRAPEAVQIGRRRRIDRRLEQRGRLVGELVRPRPCRPGQDHADDRDGEEEQQPRLVAHRRREDTGGHRDRGRVQRTQDALAPLRSPDAAFGEVDDHPRHHVRQCRRCETGQCQGDDGPRRLGATPVVEREDEGAGDHRLGGVEDPLVPAPPGDQRLDRDGAGHDDEGVAVSENGGSEQEPALDHVVLHHRSAAQADRRRELERGDHDDQGDGAPGQDVARHLVRMDGHRRCRHERGSEHDHVDEGAPAVSVPRARCSFRCCGPPCSLRGRRIRSCCVRRYGPIASLSSPASTGGAPSAGRGCARR